MISNFVPKPYLSFILHAYFQASAGFNSLMPVRSCQVLRFMDGSIGADIMLQFDTNALSRADLENMTGDALLRLFDEEAASNAAPNVTFFKNRLHMSGWFMLAINNPISIDCLSYITHTISVYQLIFLIVYVNVDGGIFSPHIQSACIKALFCTLHYSYDKSTNPFPSCT